MRVLFLDFCILYNVFCRTSTQQLCPTVFIISKKLFESKNQARIVFFYLDALDYGLLNDVVPEDELQKTVGTINCFQSYFLISQKIE